MDEFYGIFMIFYDFLGNHQIHQVFKGFLDPRNPKDRALGDLGPHSTNVPGPICTPAAEFEFELGKKHGVVRFPGHP